MCDPPLMASAGETPLPEASLLQIMALWGAATPAPVTVIMLPEDRDPVDWYRDCLAKNIHTVVYGVAVGTPESVEGQDAVVTALTGNGPRSQANATFYAMCHEVIPRLVKTLEQTRYHLREHRDMRGDDKCHLDDHELYEATLPEGDTRPARHEPHG